MKKLFILLALAVAAVSARAAVTDTIVVKSEHLAVADTVMTIVPQKALDDTAAVFPTVYLLNGYGGDHRTWSKLRDDMPALSDLYGMIFVMPQGQDSWYWDSREGMEMESFIVEDLVPYIDATLPTVKDPAKRAITGLSMGGHGAMWLAIRHSDIWGSAASMSGGLDIRPFPTRWKMAKHLGDYESNTDVWDAHTVINLVPQLKPGQLNITFDCGVDDFFINVNRNFHKALLEAKIPHDYTERPGGHSMPYWANSTLYHLLFFNEVFKK